MANKLTIDEGNSSTKFALWRDDAMVSVATYKKASLDALCDFVASGMDLDSIIFCSVRRGDNSPVLNALHALAPKVIVLDAFTPLPITIGYRTPATLGADRIAAAVGATVVAPGRSRLVVDMGTAITYDVVTATNRFVGGNIAPGIFVRLEAMNHFTSALPLIETDGDVPRWGFDTATALRSGAIRGVVGELQYYRHCMRSHDCAVILTGGSHELVTPFITTPIIVEPNLVLIGLNRILDYNETLAS